MHPLETVQSVTWSEILAPYQTPTLRAGLWQLFTSALPFVLLWGLMVYSLNYAYGVTLLVALPTASFLIRLFIIQHDCGHGAFFPSRAANNALGFMLGILTLTPYAYWRKTHAVHHASSGNLDRRGCGDITTLTIREYNALPPLRQRAYRLYRHPLLMFLIGPAFQFIVKHRFPWDLPTHHNREWRSIHLTNLVLVLLVGLLGATIGFQRFLLVQGPITLVASAMGVWLFYIQHQFEHTYWQHRSQWDFSMAGLRGSSYYDLPVPLRWLTANIGLHHIHHLHSQIPNYKLQQCFNDIPALQQVSRLTLWQSFRCASLKLWDEDQQKLVGFQDAAAIRHSRPVPPPGA
jgi:omega-6 fatty acid desaturase (delta-12 desaturase)